MTADEVRQSIRLVCENMGGQKVFAERVGVSQQYVSDVLNEKREPGPSILSALGLEKVVTYRSVKG